MSTENTSDAKKVLIDRRAVLAEKFERVSAMKGKEAKAKAIGEKLKVVDQRLADLDKPSVTK